MTALSLRLATEDDVPAITAMMARAIDALQTPYLTPDQVAASRTVMGLDRQLIADRSYVVVEDDNAIIGCGGWSDRATLYGGDHSVTLRDARRLDPAHDPARIRAMFTDPDHVRRGVGRMILAACERMAAAAGFGEVDLMATLAGEPLYRACGYREIERVTNTDGAVAVPLVRMRKSIATA